MDIILISLLVLLVGIASVILYLNLRSKPKDENEKKIVEVKGRRIASTQYKDTIITTSKITNGFQAIDQGYKVFLVFVFTDKAMYHELKEDDSFECKLTGTNCIQHYMIPIANLKEFDYEECEPEEIISEE